jgi:serine/threonine-protein kinase
VREAGGLPHDEAWSVALQVADGLVAIHEAGVVHRDLKTANLMRDRKGAVRVMDFGIAKQHGATGGVTVTATGSLMGTPEYMSPEQLRGEDVDFRGDLYSLGVVIFELFTGGVPFRGETAVATIVRQLHDAPFLDLPQLPEPLRPVLARAPGLATLRAPSMQRALRPRMPLGAGPAGARHVARERTRRDAPCRAGGSADRADGARPGSTRAAGVHLVSAGGVAAPPPSPPPPSGAPAATPTPTPPVVVELTALPSHHRGAASQAPVVAASPVPTPLPTAPVELPTRALRPVQQPPAAPVDPRVYDEDDVDVPPRRLSGASAAYPHWGPKLARGTRVSITASFVVNEAGDVTDIRVEEGGGVLEAVLLEISRWKYEPGRKAGRPVKVRLSWKHTFIGG